MKSVEHYLKETGKKAYRIVGTKDCDGKHGVQVTMEQEYAKWLEDKFNNTPAKIEYVGMGTKPDPFKFTIVQKEIINGHSIVLAVYDGCVTFRGEKLMLIKGIVENPATLDPHFIEDHPVIARFKPTEQGWKMARVCAMMQ